ncbi:replication initiation protein [Tepidibacter formicigenes]|jgi:plasmid replication initiation protein|uniref:Initiator Replication protein n=1 Tax=Tepidibacter formicigenes DSM 15518 TaxID=1123349 RepID=A0A1M6U131_9FIRM|nr:replication initiation protein [Tepidibacter formicigenes]SHK62853.1 Initiator Replication protein [Tepidibacter formicigenes DSM 15518]
MNKVDKSFLIVQSNSLIEKKRTLTLDEQKIVLIFASLISPEDEEFKLYEIEASKIMNLLEVKNKSKYTALKETIYTLASKPIKIEDGKSFEIMQWFSKAAYKNGILKIRFDEDLKPYLLGLKELFTKYKLENILHMKSKYSIQLYELLKSHEYKKEICVSIEELRDFFNLEGKYKRYNDFKKRTILKAQEDINGKTDITFDFKEIKKGRAVKEIKFIIKSKKVIEEIKEEKQIELDIETKVKIETLKSVIGYDFKEKDYMALLDVAERDVGKIIQKYYIIKDSYIKKNKNIDNIIGLLIEAIKEDYDEVAVTTENTYRKTVFHNFEQRTSKYSAEELEKIILEKQKKK